MNDHSKPTVSASPAFRRLALTSALLLAVSSTSNAATDNWSGSINGTWDTSTLNWNSGTTAFTSGNDALFSGAPVNNVTAASGQTIGAITLDGTFTGSVALTGANTVNGATTISGGTLNLNNATGLGTSAATVDSGGTLAINPGTGSTTVANNISGAGLMTAQDPAGAAGNTLTLSGNYSGFTGTLNILAGASSNGKVNFSTATQANVPSSSATVQIQNGATLYLNKTLNYGAGIDLFGSGNAENLGALRLEAGANQTGSVKLRANSFIGVNGTAATISGVISEVGGSFSFTKLGNNTLTNSGANTYSGKTIINGGTVSVSAINNAGSSGGLGMNSTVDINNGTLQYTGAGETSDRVINLAGTTGGATINNMGAGLLKFTSNLTATGAGNKTLTLGGATGTGELAGNITNGPTGETALTKTGANTWTLSATTNTFTGQLQINGGTLVWNTAGALAPAAATFKPLNITAGGALVLNGPLRYTSGGSGNVYAYLSVGNNAAGGIGTITVNSGGTLTFTNMTSNPNSVVGQQGTGGTSKLILNGGNFNWDGSGGLAFGNSGGSGLLLITNGGAASILKGTGSPEEGWIMLGRDSNTSTGTVYLATGTLATSRIFVRDGSVGAGAGVANFTFDGGKLQALANQTDWLQSSDSGNTLALSAVTIADGGAKIDANGFSVAINNTLLHGGVAATDGGLTKLGLGTLTLGGSGHTYTGSTVVSNGILAVTGSLPSSSAVTVEGGTLTVSGNIGGTVAVQPGGAIGASSGTFSSLVTLNSGNAAINLTDASAATTTFGNGLTLNNGNTLTFELGATSDQISVPSTFTHSGTVTINLAAISGVTAGTPYTLISDGAGDITTTSGFALGVVPAGYAATLGTSGGALTVTLVQNVPSAAYWKGDVDNKWSSISGGNNSNWATDSTGATDTGALPSTPTAVTFAASGAANLNTVLGADFTINNLTLSTANNVTIGGTTNTLTLIGGLLNDTTALNNLISVSNVVLGSSQTWQNNSANALTVSSAISGSSLTIGGTGAIVLANTNNTFAGTTISSGTLQLGDALTSNGSVPGNIVDDSVLAFGNTTAQTYAGTISGTGQLTKLGAGTLTLSGSSTYGSGTTVSNGTLVILAADGASTGTVDVKSGATFVCRPQTTTTYANAVTGTGIVQLLFGDEGLGYNNTGDWFTYLDNLSGFTGTIRLSATTTTNVNKWAAGAANLSGTSSLIIDSGAQLYMNGNSLTFSTIQVTGSGNYQNRGAVRAGSGTLTGAMSLLGDTTFGTEGGTIAGTIASGAAGTQTLTLGGTADSGGNITLTADIGGGTGVIALNKIGNGSTTLSGLNTFTGTTTMGGGTLTLANGSALQNSTLALAAGSLVFDSSVSSNAFVFGGLSGSANLTLANNGGGAITLTVGNNGSNTTYSGLLSDGGLSSSLTKIGNGTLTLSGANTFSGITTVAGGKLAINTLQTNVTTGIAVNDSTTLIVNVAGTNQLAPATYTLGSSAGPVTNEFVGLSSTNVAPVNAGTITLNGSTTVNINGGSFLVGKVYPLIKYASIGGTGGFTLGSLPRGMVANIVTNGGNAIALNVTAFAPVNDVWTGSVNTNWDIATTANWLTNGVAGVYVDGDTARFDDTATTTNVFVTTAVSPGAMVVSNITKTYTFTGNAIAGGGGLTKQGSGLLVLGQVNTYNGNTVISNGTLRVGAVNAIPGGAGKGDVTLAGTLDLNGNSDVINGLSGSGTLDTIAGGTPTLTIGNSGSSSVFNGVVQNTGGTLTLIKNGSGTLTLGGNNTHSGVTTVDAGTLKLANANALGSASAGTTVATNATLDLNGQTIAENINLNSGAFLINSSASPAAISGNVIAANSSSTVIGGIGNITLATLTHVSGGQQFDVTNLNTGTIDLAGTVDNGYLNMHVAAGTVLLDKLGVGQRATSALFVEGGTARLVNTNGDQIYDGNALTINSGTFDLNGFTETVGGLVGAGGAVLNSAASTTGTLTIGGNNALGGDYYGNITDGAGVTALTKIGTGTAQTLQGINTYSGMTVIANGTLNLVGESGISNSVLVRVGGILNVASRNDGTFSLTSVQTLTGTGTVDGNLNAMSGSIINPGNTNGIGALTVSGNAALGGRLLLELNRTNTPSNCDQLMISGTPTYGGTLTVTNIGQTLQVGDTFQLFSGGVSGFASVNLATNDASGYKYTWNNNIASSGSITVATVTSPVNTTPTNVTATVSGNTLTLSWPADHLGWHLQVQTNSLATGLGTNWVTIPGSEAVISTNMTINPQNGAVFYRLVYP